MTSKEKIEAIKKCILNWDKKDIKGFDDILNDLERLEKQDKILDIVFEKNVDTQLVQLSTNWLDYYTRVKHRTGRNTELTEEELNLIKEWLDGK